MPYRISGTLKLPSGVVAAGVDIKFRALKSFSPLIEQAEITVRTDTAGKYDVSLEFNTYVCEVTFSTNRPFNAGQFTVASNTVVGQDLPTLLQQAGWTPATPEWIVQIQTWLAEANASAAAADTSAKAAKVSETNSKASETSASSSASSALSSKNASKTSETNAATSASQASASASQASTSANQASTSETNAATSASAAAQSQTAAKASETAALDAAHTAEQAAQTVVGALVDGGQYNPSSGQLPTPVTSGSKKLSTIWKVTGIGVVEGIDLGTGDSLIYTSRDNSYYKIDNTESVSKVNNKTGVVVLNATDVNAAPSGFGLGEQQAYTVEDMNSDPTIWNGGGIGWFRGISTTTNKPDNRTGVGIATRYQRGTISTVSIIYFAGADIYSRGWTGTEWRDWSKLYGTANKPTPVAIGAEPLGAAAGAVEAAALPLPDLWAPLTDSLRLINGYGREVKVGEEVIASFLEFSRPTAATTVGRDGLPIVVQPNAPRFVDGWLVFEGPATNLTPWSEDFTQWVANVSPLIEKQSGIFTKITPTGQSSGPFTAITGLVPGDHYTVSFWAYTIPSAVAGQFDIGPEGTSASTIKTLTSVPTRYVIPFVAADSSVTVVAYGSSGGVAQDPFFVGGFQVERGDGSTSYIPTSGAAATRAGESMTVRKENLPTGDFSIAVEVGTVRSHTPYAAHVYREDGSFLWLRREGDTNNVSAPSLQVDLNAALGTCVHRVNRTGQNPCVKLRAGGKRSEALQTLGPFTGPLVFGTQGGEPCFMKIRNLRLWGRYLTDEQERAVG